MSLQHIAMRLAQRGLDKRFTPKDCESLAAMYPNSVGLILGKSNGNSIVLICHDGIAATIMEVVANRLNTSTLRVDSIEDLS